MNKIAILLATYNGERYLKEMIESLKCQSFQEYVCYIHDDGSTDGTCEVIDKYCMDDPIQFKRLLGPATGSAKASFMWMLSQVEAEYYMFADQDDVWIPEKIEKTMKCLENNSAWCVGTDLCVTDENLNVIAPNMMEWIGCDLLRNHPHQLMIDNVVAGCTMLFNRKLRDIAIQCKNVDKIFMHDQWVAVIAAMYGKLTVLNESTILYRQHGDNEKGAVHENIGGKLLRLRRELLLGSMRKEKKRFLQESRDLAKELNSVNDLPEHEREFLKEFAQIEEKSKLQRILFYKKNKLSRKSKLSTLWMWMWV